MQFIKRLRNSQRKVPAGIFTWKGKTICSSINPQRFGWTPVNLLLKQRDAAEIMENNIFVFASTVKFSSNHCSGWHAVRDICKAAHVNVNGNCNIHRISTIYARLDMSADDQQTYRDHMGHDATISKENYQCSAAIMELRVMGETTEWHRWR